MAEKKIDLPEDAAAIIFYADEAEGEGVTTSWSLIIPNEAISENATHLHNIALAAAIAQRLAEDHNFADNMIRWMQEYLRTGELTIKATLQ